MTRAEELVLKSLDESLSPAEAAELQALGNDPRLDLLREVEGALRGRRPVPDFGKAVVESIRRDQTDRVMEAVKASPPAWLRRAPAWPRVAAAAALFLVAILAGLLKDEPLARVVEGDPDAFFVRGEESLKAVPGLVVRPGDSLLTCSRDITLRYEGESTLVRIVPLSEIVLQGDRRGKRIELREGEIEADVAPQETPLVITASHGRAEVLGTKLRMSATKDATRLEVEKGNVRFTRKGDGAALVVGANQYTVAIPDQELVACEMMAAAEVAPWISGFSLIRDEFPREEIIEDLKDGAVISLSKLPTRFLNLRANTEPDRVGSVRFAYKNRDPFNTEQVWPYTLLPNDGCGGPSWEPKPGRHVITATPFTGSYGNGLRGEPRTITLTIVE